MVTAKDTTKNRYLLQIVHDELVKLMGGEVSELAFAKSGPTVILLAGLQGVGKTTVCAKLAFYLKKLVYLSLSLSVTHTRTKTHTHHYVGYCFHAVMGQYSMDLLR